MPAGWDPSRGAPVGASGELSGVRALVCDVFGTVVDWRASVVRESEALERAKRLTVDWPRFADEWRREGYHDAIARIGRGELPWADADTLHRRKLDELLPAYGLAGLSEAEVADFSRVWHRLDPWPDAVPGLTRLKRKYVIAPLSNGTLALLTHMARRAGLPWDCVLAADLFGAYKPDPRTYLGAARLLGLPPGELMMVAAHGGDLRAAGALGLHTAFVARPDEWGEDGPAEARPRASTWRSRASSSWPTGSGRSRGTLATMAGPTRPSVPRAAPGTVRFVCRCCGHRSVGAPRPEPPGFVMRCAACGTEYATVDDPAGDVQGAIDRSHTNRRLADSLR